MEAIEATGQNVLEDTEFATLNNEGKRVHTHPL
jgi:hypothetical protein